MDVTVPTRNSKCFKKNFNDKTDTIFLALFSKPGMFRFIGIAPVAININLELRIRLLPSYPTLIIFEPTNRAGA